jgi:hypothetical protein
VVRPVSLKVGMGDFAFAASHRRIAISLLSTSRSKPTPAAAAAFLVVTGKQARRQSAGLCAKTSSPSAVAVGPFDPIRHSRRAKLAAAATALARAQGWHRCVSPVGHVDRALVAAVPASHEQADALASVHPCNSRSAWNLKSAVTASKR